MDGPYLVFPLVLHLHLLQIQEQRPRLSSHLWGDPLVDSPAHLQERRGPKTGAGDTWHNGCSGEVASAWTWAGLYMWRGHVWSTLWCPGPEWPGKPQGTQGSSLQSQDVQVSTFRLPWYLLQFLSIFTHLVARLMSWALCWKRGHGGVSQAASFPRVALTQGHDLRGGKKAQTPHSPRTLWLLWGQAGNHSHTPWLPPTSIAQMVSHPRLVGAEAMDAEALGAEARLFPSARQEK